MMHAIADLKDGKFKLIEITELASTPLRQTPSDPRLPWDKILNLHIMRYADFRPMVNNKSLTAIETMVNSFLFPCKFTAISFCIPLERVLLFI